LIVIAHVVACPKALALTNRASYDYHHGVGVDVKSSFGQSHSKQGIEIAEQKGVAVTRTERG